jgi:hypothetical protein
LEGKVTPYQATCASSPVKPSIVPPINEGKQPDPAKQVPGYSESSSAAVSRSESWPKALTANPSKHAATASIFARFIEVENMDPPFKDLKKNISFIVPYAWQNGKSTTALYRNTKKPAFPALRGL